MPTLPWQKVDIDPVVSPPIAMLTYLPLNSAKDTPRFFLYICQIYVQLRKTKGLLGFSLRAHPLSKQYWTLSLWRDNESMHKYIHTSPHVHVMTKMQTRMGETAFSSWVPEDSEKELQWAKAFLHQVKKY